MEGVDSQGYGRLSDVGQWQHIPELAHKLDHGRFSSRWNPNLVHKHALALFQLCAYEATWTGRPLQPADIRKNYRGAACASWNGATDVYEWRLFKSSSKDGPFELVGTALKDGFETRFTTTAYRPWTFVKAVGADGAFLGRSEKIATYVSNAAVALITASRPQVSC